MGQVVVGLGSWWVGERGEKRQVFYSPVVEGSKLLDRGQRVGPATLTFTMHQGCKIGNRGVGYSVIQSLFRDKTSSSVQLSYICW